MPTGSPRRRVELALGALWLIDGLLQLQPAMFHHEFFPDLLGMSAMGLPTSVASVWTGLGRLLGAHPVVVNVVFAVGQLALGAGLLRPRTARWARRASVVWALAVWVLGEGFGGLFMGGTSLLTGAPGAALIYAAIASGGRRLAKAAWVATFVGGALLELTAVNHAPGVPAAQVVAGGGSLPGFLGAAGRGAAHLIAGDGLAVAGALGAVATIAGLGVLVPAWRRGAVWVGAALAVVTGLLGQGLGGIAAGSATDPGTGPVLILLAATIAEPHVRSWSWRWVPVLLPWRGGRSDRALVGPA